MACDTGKGAEADLRGMVVTDVSRCSRGPSKKKQRRPRFCIRKVMVRGDIARAAAQFPVRSGSLPTQTRQNAG